MEKIKHRHQSFLLTPIITGCSNNRPDYEYGRLISTTLLYVLCLCSGLCTHRISTAGTGLIQRIVVLFFPRVRTTMAPKL